MDQLKEHPQIVELLDTLDKNGLMKEKNEVQSLVSYIGGMEETLTGMLGELQDMRREIKSDPQQHAAEQVPYPCGKNGEQNPSGIFRSQKDEG